VQKVEPIAEILHELLTQACDFLERSKQWAA
jgi:hypothetical protein